MECPDEVSIVGVIGDVHTEAGLLKTAIAFFKQQSIQTILCVGDIVDGPGDVNECCRILAAENVIAVAGNHEEWLLTHQLRDLKQSTLLRDLSTETRTYLQVLPTTHEFQTPNGSAMLCHGLGANNMACVKPDDYGYAIAVNEDLHALIQARRYRYILNGHTHRPMVRRFGTLTIINAGTLKAIQNPGCVIVDFAESTAQFFAFDRDRQLQARETVHF